MSTMGFQPYDGTFPIIQLPEQGAAFAAGDCLYLSGGYLIVSDTYAHIQFVALDKYAAVTGTMHPVIEIMPSQRWVAQASATTAETNKGYGGPIVYTTGSQAVTPETSNTSHEEFIVDQLHPNDGATTGAGGRVIGHFNVLSSGLVYQAVT